VTILCFLGVLPKSFDYLGLSLLKDCLLYTSLQGIFDPATATSFRWMSWKRVRRQRNAIFAYQVDRAHSRYMVASGVPGDIHHAVVGFRCV